ncbi:CopY/TcrY family copper transport repressor [Leptotrichia sp. OH3620_COT-345]|uniref:CopY/TcrY family copper transport repressor n=1 Tax=Leptotrichia sp. OH3620_COT-345 TaxID=2491048 RepID=UPI000F64693B|nr:CopY/TcrY family copper transport repressor [Leptotrichia sp. OH3620_COT-345]RRD39061.1 CopY/TcrY family copper transport repressor [Leptotrichia sp. OH3620_COT-345]
MEENSICHITGAEWEIMRTVWANKEITAKSVSEILGEKMKWKHTTVKTLLNRLLEKGVLKKKEKGNRYIYYTEYNEQEIAKGYVMETFNRICKTKIGKMIEEVIENSVLSYDDLRRIQKVTEKKKETAVQKVHCLCLPGQCNCPEHCYNNQKEEK